MFEKTIVAIPALLGMAFSLAVTAVSPAAGADVAGPASVVDGDTLTVAGTEVDLDGIDAPELGQQCQNRRGRAYDCGQSAARHLRLLLGRREVRCAESQRDAAGRVLARCSIGPHDIGRQMVVEGWALADPEHDVYRREEQAARGLRDGMWKGRFISPWDWRAGKRLPPPAAD